MSQPRDSLPSRSKVRDRSIVHLLVGIVLLLPPVVGVSHIDAKLAGVPVPLLYLFGVWIGLIVVALMLAGPLSRGDRTSATAETTDVDT